MGARQPTPDRSAEGTDHTTAATEPGPGKGQTRKQRQGQRTAEAIRACAVRLFATFGFQATTQRQLATAAGINVGSLYNHIQSKDALLAEVMSEIMLDLVDEMSEVLAMEGAPVERLRTAIELHVTFHATRAQEVFIGNSELRSLLPEDRAHVVALRDRYERMFESLISDGVAKGDFHTDDTRMVVYATSAIGAHVASWYRPGGEILLEVIASSYAEFILRGLMSGVAVDELLVPADRLDRLIARSAETEATSRDWHVDDER